MTKSTGVGRRPPSRRTHGHSFINGKPSAEYQAWASMKRRCLNPTSKNFPLYGGRGIRVCRRWIDSFENFLEDLGPRPSKDHSLDRFPDNNGDYEAANCRWATKQQQARNTRTVNIVNFKGSEVSLPDLVDRMGLKLPTVRQRLNRGWNLARALK